MTPQRHNAFEDGTVEEARQRYHEIGLCYTCAHRFGKCSCGDNPEWKQAGLVDKCVCFEFAGDNPNCPVHKSLDGYTPTTAESAEASRMISELRSL